MARNRCHIHNLYWFEAAGGECEAFFYITSIDSTTINYDITSSDFPVYVRLYEGETLVATNIHNSGGSYSFTGTFDTDHIISYSNACGADIVYLLQFDCICPEGYIAVGDECRKTDDISATSPTTPSTLVPETYSAYNWRGTIVYDTNWDSEGVGTVTHHFTDSWWRNSDFSATSGPLNRTGVWANNKTSDQDVGFTFCANISETKTYWVGVSSDNYVYIKVNGVLQFTQDLTNIFNSLQTQGYGVDVEDRVSWQYWMIYPVVLEAGKNIIEVVGHNISMDAAVGCEIYNAPDATTIGTWRSYAEMGNNLLFSSKDEIGNEVQIGNLGYGYTCPEGYSLVLCEDSIVCRKIETTECQSLCFGYLYNHYTISDARELTSSSDWSVPSDTEFDTVVAYMGGLTVAGGKLKETGLLFWNFPNNGATNEFGFNLRGAGRRIHTTGEFEGLALYAYMWSSTLPFVGNGRYYMVANNTAALTKSALSQKNGMAIRLIKDATGIPDGTTTTYTGNDGKTYNAVAINELYWTTENLEETKYRNGDYIQGYDGGVYTPIDNTTWAGLTTGALCLYDNNLTYQCK